MRWNWVNVWPILGLLILMACGGQDRTDPINPGGNTSDDIAPELPRPTTGVAKPASNFTVGATPLIGAAGGSLTSQDGRLTLTVPPGAVSDFTIFGIQLVENRLLGGLGLAYRVSAKVNGGNEQEATLLRPLELAFTLPSGLLANTAPEDLLLAYQGADGRWQISSERQTEVMPQVAGQAAGGVRLRGTFQKSGDYAVAPRYKLHPSRGTVKINARLTLTALKLTPTTAVGGYGSYSLLEFSQVPATGWAVNGVAGGSDTLGRLIPTSGESQKQYKAPGRKPSPNPVRITAQVSEGGRTLTLSSAVQVEDSKGWLEVSQEIYRTQRRNTSEEQLSLEVEGQAQYAFDLSEAFVFAPGNNFDGGGAFQTRLRPGASAALRINYSLNVDRPCLCEEVNERRSIVYRFTSSGEPTPLPRIVNNPVQATVRPSGAYTLSALVGIQVEGDYTFSFTETSRCNNQPLRPAVNRSGKDTATFISLDDSQFSMEGTVRPKGPDRMVGSTSQYGTLFMPKKELNFANEKGSLIPSWFLPYEPDDLAAPQQEVLEPRDPLGLLQSRVLAHKPPRPGQNAGPQLPYLSDLEPQSSPRFAACRSLDPLTARAPHRPPTQ